jgi:hypothetical protein
MKPEHHHHRHHHQNEKGNVNNNINKGQKITNSTFSTKVKSYFPSEERARDLSLCKATKKTDARKAKRSEQVPH